MSVFDTDDTPATIAGRRVTAAVRDLVLAAHGRVVFVERPIFPGAATTDLVRRHAYAEGDRQITQARAQGVPWIEIGRALGYDDQDEHGRTPDEQAFERMASGDRFDRSVGWTCTSCSQWVKDRDPAGGTHPEDLEQGHAENCARLPTR
jgi:hypothetical protein